MSEEYKIESTTGRILIIDDEQVIAEALAEMLRREEFSVDTATSGKEGIDKFIETRHDLVLTDLRLGDMIGTDVLAKVKQINPITCVVIITGYATTESAVEAMRLGANDYLTKPVRMSELVRTVRTQISSMLLEKQIKSLNRAVEAERDKLRRSVTELDLLKRLAGRMMTALSYIEGFDLILNLLVEEINADIAVTYMIENNNVRTFTASESSHSELEQVMNIINEQGRELFGIDLNCDIEQFKSVEVSDDIAESSLKSCVVVPLQLENRPFALLIAGSRLDENFETVWSDFIVQLSQEASEFLSHVKRSVERQRHSTAAIVEHTLDGIAMINPATEEVLMNPRAHNLLDLPSGEIPNIESLGERLGCDLKETWHNLTQNEKENGKKNAVLQAEITHHGKPLFLRLNISVLPNIGGDDDSLLLVMHDVTKERAVEAMKNRLISNISHELRTPTAVVKEFIALILDGISGPLNEAQIQYIKIIQSNAERLSRLIENLLTLARSDTGGFTVVLQPTELLPIIQNVKDSMSLKLTKKQMQISTIIPENLPLVYADQDAVTQILTNLVENAFKYSDIKTEVEISVNVKGARIELAVADRGYGIAPEDQEDIFKPFHRLVDQDDPKFQEGVGLGLPVVKDLVTRHGGDIWVDSKVGEGSTFTFSLQVAESTDELRPA